MWCEPWPRSLRSKRRAWLLLLRGVDVWVLLVLCGKDARMLVKWLWVLGRC